MSQHTTAILVTILFSAIGAAGDYFLKRASDAENSYTTKWFLLGFIVYSSTAFGWVFVMKHLKLAVISAFYSVSMILMLAAIGYLFWGERLSPRELTGVALAIGALFLMASSH